MRVLVCGSRDWTRQAIVSAFLTGMYDDDPDLVVIEGGAKGADKCAATWCEKNGFVKGKNWLQFPADWDNLPRWEAGPARNKKMLEEGKPDVIVAFKDEFEWWLHKGGTENMVKQGKDAGVPCYIFSKYTYK